VGDYHRGGACGRLHCTSEYKGASVQCELSATVDGPQAVTVTAAVFFRFRFFLLFFAGSAAPSVTSVFPRPASSPFSSFSAPPFPAVSPSSSLFSLTVLLSPQTKNPLVRSRSGSHRIIRATSSSVREGVGRPR